MHYGPKLHELLLTLDSARRVTDLTRRMGLSLELPIVPPRQGTLRAVRLLFGLDLRW